MSTTAQTARRMYERRSTDTCISQIGDHVYPVENWSQGGVLLSGDNRFLGANEVYDLTMRFKLRDRVLNVSQKARVVRMTGTKAALQFLPLTREVRGAFQTVIDDLVAGQFANSQA
jgi:hypothetical protein